MTIAVATPTHSIDGYLGSGARDVAMITEGTYPFFRGGVSVWCDQMVRHMVGYRFSIHALVGSGSERIVWNLPANVRSVQVVPLWSPGTPFPPDAPAASIRPVGRAAPYIARQRRVAPELRPGAGRGDRAGQGRRLVLLAVHTRRGRPDARPDDCRTRGPARRWRRGPAPDLA